MRKEPRTPIADITKVLNDAVELDRQERDMLAKLDKAYEEAEVEVQRARDDLARIKKFYAGRGEPIPDDDSLH